MAKHCRIVTAEAFRGQRVSGRRPGLGQRRGQHEQSGELVTCRAQKEANAPGIPRGLAALVRPGAARDVVGIRRGAISGNMKVSFQAARSIG